MTPLQLINSRWFKITAGIAVLCLVVLLGTPLLAKHLAQQWLMDNGGDQVRFEDIDFNPFAATLVLDGLEVKVDAETTLAFETVAFDLAWLPLLHRQVDVQSVQLTGFHIVVDNRDPEAPRFGGISLPGDEGPAPEPAEAVKSTWLSGIQSLTLQNFNILVRDQKLQLDIALDSLTLTSMAQWTPEQAATLEIAGRINDAPFALNGLLAPFAEHPRYDLDLSVERLQLAAFEKLAAPAIDQLSGLFSYVGKIVVEQSGAELGVKEQGKIAVESLQVARSATGLETSIEFVSRDGELGIALLGSAFNLGEDSEIAVESIRLAMREQGVETSIQQVSRAGKLAIAQTAGALKLSESGKTSVESLSVAMSAAGLETSIGQLSHDGELALGQSDDGLELSESGKTSIESLRLTMDEPGLETSIGQFSLDGKLGFDQSGKMVALTQDGTARLGPLDVRIRQPALDVQNENLALTTRVAYSDSPSENELQLASDFALKKLDVNASQRKASLVSAETLNVEKLVFNAADQLSIAVISSEQIRVASMPDQNAELPEPIASSDKLQVTGLERSGQLITIEGVAYEGFHNRIVKDSDGKFNVLRFVDLLGTLNAPSETTEQTAADAPESTDEEGKTEPVDLQIGRIRASEGSSVTFIDASVEPAFVTTVVLQELSLEQLDTRKPDQKSKLRLEGAIGKHTRLSLNGDLQPFLAPVSVDLAGKIQAMDLPALSSYTWETLGLMLDSGTLDADLKLANKDDILDGKVDMVLHQLKLGKVDSQSGLQSKLPVPTDTALNTLRDKNNTIKLTVPVKGNMADPKFDISDAINQVLAKALRAGALSYLKHALQPYGTVITAVQYAGEAVTKVRLNPLEFEAGQVVLTATGEEYLAKVAEVMRERPKIAIKLCGVAVEQDSLFLQQQKLQQLQQQQIAAGAKAPGQPPVQPVAVDERALTELATQRAAVVKDHLVEKHQIAASHLVGCRSRVESGNMDAKPRTDLLI